VGRGLRDRSRGLLARLEMGKAETKISGRARALKTGA